MVMACGVRVDAVRVLAVVSALGVAACARPNPAFEGETETSSAATEADDDDGIGASSSRGDDGSVDGTAEDDALPDDGGTRDCGDGVRDVGEECDEGELNDDKGSCKSDCTHNVCGDGFKGPGQPCDDGNRIAGDGCTDCMLDSCGDGVLDDGEECDPRDPGNGEPCTPFCTIPYCGDAFTSPQEQCDDGNGDDADECTNACTNPVCGDGVTTVTESYVEECDDAIDDLCFECVMAFCGDGHVSTAIGEECEPGVSVPLSCANSENVQGAFSCDEFECTWGTPVEACCISQMLPCATDEMCCGEMLCLRGFCV